MEIRKSCFKYIGNFKTSIQKHSLPDVLKYMFFKNFAKFTGKLVCWNLFLVVSCEFYEISKNIFSTEHPRTIAFAYYNLIELNP